MKAIVWLLLLTLVGATCPDYAIWVSQDRTPPNETIGRVLPELDFEKFKALNPWYTADSKPQTGRIYKLPYDESMSVVPPASWSASCPKTLVLDSDQKDAETQSWLRRNSIDIRARGHQSTSSLNPIVARSKEASIDAKETQTSTSTEISMTAAPEPTETKDPTHCQEKQRAAEQFELSYEKRVQFATTFCYKLKNTSLTLQQPIKTEPYADTLIGVTLLNDCDKRHFKLKQVWECIDGMMKINTGCPDFGGSYRTSCLFYYFLKRDDRADSISTLLPTPTPS